MALDWRSVTPRWPPSYQETTPRQRQRDRRTDRQTDRQTDRRTEKSTRQCGRGGSLDGAGSHGGPKYLPVIGGHRADRPPARVAAFRTASAVSGKQKHSATAPPIPLSRPAERGGSAATGESVGSRHRRRAGGRWAGRGSSITADQLFQGPHRRRRGAACEPPPPRTSAVYPVWRAPAAPAPAPGRLPPPPTEPAGIARITPALTPGSNI